MNGQLVLREQASIGLNDLGLLRGYGIFDYLLFQDFRARYLDDHLQRFFRSAQLVNLTIPISRDELLGQIHRLIEVNDTPEGGLQLLLTGGYSADGYTPGAPNLIIMQGRYVRTPAELYEQGVRLMLYAHQRDLPEVKSTNYFTGIRLQPLMRQMGAQFLLYHDHEGHLSESDRSNFFLLTAEGELATPGTGVLRGITRQRVLEVARDLGIPTRERAVSREELVFAQEAFLTSTTKGVLPVVRVDEHTIGTGRPGPIAQQLHAVLCERARQTA